MNGKRTLAVAIALLAMLVTSGWAATLEVTQPVQVTSNSYYERGQAIVYDGTDYWLFYGRSTSCTGTYETGVPDVHDYAIHYKKAATVPGLVSATATAVPGATSCYNGEIGAAVVDGKIWTFAAVPSVSFPGSRSLYGWYTTDGTSWTQVADLWDDMPNGAAHHDEVGFDGKLYIMANYPESYTGWYSKCTDDPTAGTITWSTPIQLNTTTNHVNGTGHFYVEGTSLYIGIMRTQPDQTNFVLEYVASPEAWSELCSAVSTAYDPTLFKVGSTYVYAQAPWVSPSQYIIAWSGSSLSTVLSGSAVSVTEGAYGSNGWVDMWPIGFTDNGGTSYLFYTSERDEPAAEGAGNIWYLEVDWTVSNNHYTYIQEAIDSAVSADRIEVDAGIYAEYLHVTMDNLTIEGAGIDQSIIDLDGLMPYWHYSGCSSSYASRGGVLFSGYGSPDEIIEDIVFRGFTVKNAGLNPPAGGAYPEFVDPGLDGQDDVRGISVHNGKNILIDECKVEHSGYFGISTGKARCTSLTQSELVTITDCICSDNCNTGISMGDYVGPITITGNTCSNNKMPWTWYDANREYAGKGIEVVGKSSSNPPTGVISGNACTANGYQGIVLKNYSDGMVVEQNTVSGHNFDEDGAGIFFYARSSTPANCVNDTIRNNTLSGNIRGIIGYYAQDALIEDNTISTESGTYDSGQEGIKLDGCNGCLVTGNTLTNCDGTGIKTQNTWDSVECYSNTVTGNTITNANGPGIRASSGSHDNTFDGNTINGADFAGIFIYLGAYDNTFTDNLVTGVTTETFYAGEDYEATQGDGIFLWGYNGDFDARAGTGNTFSGNGVYGNAGDGIENQVDSMTADASGNWWGSTVGATVATAVGSYVDYTPWLAGGTALNPGYAGDCSTLHVDDDSPQTGTATRLQEGHDLASGSTVNVADGTYGADPATGKAVYITKDNFSLIGQSEAGTIIDGAVGGVGSSGSYWPKGIHVQANNVTVQNFTVKGFMGDLVNSLGYAVLHRDYAHDTPSEGYIFYDGCTVDNVTVRDNAYAIYGLCFTHLTVSDCTVSNNLGDGMFIARGCDYANIHDNVVTNSGDHGIWVGKCWMGLDASDNATIRDNVVNGAREGGISFVGSDGAVIEGNVITNAAGDGWSVGALSLKDGPSNVTARYNLIYGNDGTWNGYAGTGHGIGIDGTPSNITLNWNSIYGNAGDGCNNSSTVNVGATYNWWGDASGPSGSGPGSGDAVTDYVDYDPWIGKAGGENIVCDPDPQVISLADDAGGGVYKDEVVVDYLGGGSGDLWGYSVDVAWDNTVVSAVLTDFSRPDNGPFSTMPGYLFQVVVQESDVHGPKKVRIDAALGGSTPGTSGPCELFKAVFTAVGTPDYATSAVDLTIQEVRDSNNQDLTGFFTNDGEVIVDLVGPVITGVSIENDTVYPTTGSHAWVKDTDNLTVYATVTDGGGLASVTADVGDFGGGGLVAPDASTTYEWTLTSVNTSGANVSVGVEVTATDTYGNTSTGSDVITADNTVPGAISGFAAAPGHNKAVLSWDNPTTTDGNFYQVEIQSNAWGNYPTYTGGTSYPTDQNDGTDVWAGTGNGHTVAYATDSTERNIHYYSAFACDWALNYGPYDNDGKDRSTNYWLGDVARPDNTWNPDGYVYDPDIVKLSGIYGSAPTGDFQKCDVGPTDDHSRVGIPVPDNSVSFEDLMIFAMNYDVVAPARIVPFLVEPGVGDLALALAENGRTDSGVLELALRLEGNLGEVKGLTAELEFEGLEFLSARLSDEMSLPLADMFFWSNATSHSVQVDAAVLGTDVTIGGSGDVAVLTFQVLDETYAVDFTSAQLRGAGNEDLTAELEGLSSEGVPVAFKLVQNSPNPFNPVTKVAYHVPSESRVTIRVFDVTGRVVTTLVDGVVEAGRHAVVWNGTNDRGESVGSGIYFCTMETPDYRSSLKMTLLK